MSNPVFLFARRRDSDAILLTVKQGSRKEVFELDGMKFDINPVATLPDAYAKHEELYRASIDTFRSLHDDHQALSDAQGS